MRATNCLVSGTSLLAALALSICGAAFAAAPTTDAVPDATGLRLAASHLEPAPQQAGRYALRARFQRGESAGELREGGDFVLLGRFAKAGVGCDANTIFRNGFES